MKCLVVMFAIGCSSTPAKSIDAAVAACPTTPCSATQFCYTFEAGVVPVMPGCNDLPASCAAAPTCACVEATITCGGTLSCDATNGVHVTCANP